MQCFLVASILACLLAAAHSQHKYTTKYDNVNVDGILNNERSMNSYHKCLMGTGGCTPEGRLLRDSLPEALETHCAKCSDAQKKLLKKIIDFLRANKPEYLKELGDKYDHDHKYRKQYGEHFENF